MMRLPPQDERSRDNSRNPEGSAQQRRRKTQLRPVQPSANRCAGSFPPSGAQLIAISLDGKLQRVPRKALFLGAKRIRQPRLRAAWLERFLLAVVGRPAGGGQDFERGADAPVGVGKALPINLEGAHEDAP